jgi:Leucine-rich repeat (LRR) protein
MFIKKDRRRIEEILTDVDDSKESLQLTKRAPEFNGNLRILCREINIPYLSNLKVLNLYDNSLNNLNGIGYLAQTPLEELNLGCNQLSSIPIEVIS